MRQKPKCPKCAFPIEEPNENAVKRGLYPLCRPCCMKERSLKGILVVERKQS